MRWVKTISSSLHIQTDTQFDNFINELVKSVPCILRKDFKKYMGGGYLVFIFETKFGRFIRNIILIRFIYFS